MSLIRNSIRNRDETVEEHYKKKVSIQINCIDNLSPALKRIRPGEFVTLPVGYDLHFLNSTESAGPK